MFSGSAKSVRLNPLQPPPTPTHSARLLSSSQSTRARHLPPTTRFSLPRNSQGFVSADLLQFDGAVFSPAQIANRFPPSYTTPTNPKRADGRSIVQNYLSNRKLCKLRSFYASKTDVRTLGCCELQAFNQVRLLSHNQVSDLC